MEKLLPVTQPPITTYPGIAQPLSILFSDREQIMPWFIPRYMQIAALTQKEKLNEGISMGNFIDATHEMTYGLKEYRLPRKLINSKWGSFLDFLHDCIDCNYYIHISLNMYYFPCSPSYHSKSYMHFPMIYGYSDKLEQFYVADFYKNLIYSFETVSYGEMSLAYENAVFDEVKKGIMFDYLYYVLLWEKTIDFERSVFPGLKKQDFTKNADISEFSDIITDYIESKDSTHCLINNPKLSGIDFFYGLEYYDAIAYNIENKYYDARALHVLCDQKSGLSLKLDYLFQHGNITEKAYEVLKEKCKILYDLSFINRAYLIKGNLSGNYNFVDKLINNIHVAKDRDLELCNDLLSALNS